MPGKGRGKGKAILTWVVFSIALLVTVELLRRRSERIRGVTPG